MAIGYPSTARVILVPSRQRRRPGSVLLPTLFVVVVVVMLLSGTLSLTVSGYGLARADQERVAALAAAEAGLNWEIARINNRLWDVDDNGTTVIDGSGNPALDLWPDGTTAPPATVSAKTLMTDASGQWTQRFLVGTSANPFSAGWLGTFGIIAEGQARAPDGHVVKRRVQCGGIGLTSIFDSVALYAFGRSASTWTLGGSSSVIGTCGSNGQISGNGGPTITVGPIGLWGPNASLSGVTTTGVQQITRSRTYETDTSDEAANLFLNGTTIGPGVAGWRPTGYNADGTSMGPADKYGRKVNSQAEVVNSDGSVQRAIKANEFLDGSGNTGQPELDGRLVTGNGRRLRLKPGIYYFAKINLGNSDTVEIANDFYKANGTTPLWDSNHNPINGPATVADYNSDGNRITVFVDAVTVSGNNPYVDSSIGSGLYSALQGGNSASNPLRYRRPGNFRIYAKNTGGFGVTGSNSGSVEFSCNLLHYNRDSSSSSYGSISLSSGCHLYGGLFGWTIDMSGSAIVEKYGSGVFTGSDPVTVIPLGSSTAGAFAGGFGTWQWQELPCN